MELKLEKDQIAHNIDELLRTLKFYRDKVSFSQWTTCEGLRRDVLSDILSSGSKCEVHRTENVDDQINSDLLIAYLLKLKRELTELVSEEEIDERIILISEEMRLLPIKKTDKFRH